MTLHERNLSAIPAETARVARAAFPQGNVYLQLRDELGVLYPDEDFRSLFSLGGQPAESPGRLALVMVMQFMEDLTDRQAADAVRGRIDWKYALGLELTDEGFDYSVLCEFRARLIAGGAEERLLERLLDLGQERGWVRADGRQRTDTTHVLAAIRVLNRLECVGETLRHALEVLAGAAPAWLACWLPPEWAEVYGRPVENYRLPHADAERLALALQTGTDGYRLLEQVYAPTAPAWLREVDAVEGLRQVWVQQYELRDGQVRWREAEQQGRPPVERMIESPYDVQARYSAKRGMHWTGYKACLTETCDADTPHLITHVKTVPACTPDVGLLPGVQADLAARDLLPAEHLADAGFIDAGVLAGRGAVEIVGPAAVDTAWQAQAQQGFDQAHFVIDWEARHATCPQGHVSVGWAAKSDRSGQTFIYVRFAEATCRACPCRAVCTRHAKASRSLCLLPRPEYEALQAARPYQRTAAFRTRYAARAGIEGTLSQVVAATGLRTSRYTGVAKTHLQHVASATGVNLLRLVAWLSGVPRALTRVTRLAAMIAPALP